ncbi:Helicase MOV-10 [Actinomortierella ambigua]|uniref:RNA helicase n=1 Tax=Actinomortierella ambigua TaxID=1343610 RepID=A0A9P6PQW9_9FUNG|nr:Helicase MOV-10 [Actinomortierella ambigua]
MLPTAYLCLCSSTTFKTVEAYKQHVRTELHAKQLRAKSLIDKMAKAAQDQQRRHPASDTDSTTGNPATDIWLDPTTLHFGYRKKGKEHKIHISLENRGMAPIRLTNTIVLPRTGWGETFFAVTGPRATVIQPSSSVDYTLHFTPKNAGYYDQCVIFRFEGDRDIVGRMTGAVSDDHKVLEELAPKSPYKKKAKKDDFLQGRSVVKVQRVIVEDSRRHYSVLKKLPYYNIPSKLAVTLRLAVDDAVAAIRSQVKLPFTKKSFTQAMATMLYAEEAALATDIREYDISGAKLAQTGGKRYFLDVPGLAEARPSVIRTDSITVSPSNDPTLASKAFQGQVIEVHKRAVLIEFHPSFNDVYRESQRFDVRFSFNRQPFRRMHAAINNSSTLRFAFPVSGSSPKVSDSDFALARQTADRLRCFDGTLSTNSEQKLAVHIIANRLHGSTPFVLYGPPGTGKTVTLVEAILQIRNRTRADPQGYHILVCTPSNPSADLVLERLAAGGVDKGEMVRVNSPSRSKHTMPMKKSLRKYCFYDEDDNFLYPTLHEIDGASIVIMTNIAAGVLPFIGQLREFTHIILDEAGQCFEPETLVPLQLATARTSVVLAGDHHQLGPLVRSPVANILGLGTCMLERLVNLPPNETPYPWGQVPFKSSNICGVKLLTNYRSHPQLMSLSNRLFYNSELRYEAPSAVTDLFLQWPGLPLPGYPLKFVGVEGKDQREGNSPSWFNAFEAEAVVREIESVLAYQPRNENGPVRFGPRDIGVIVPYRKQVEKVRQLLVLKKVRDHGDIKVDTIERFQGLERTVMIVSTVRSHAQYLDMDKKFNLGFVSNPKRFNVSITRARALLIIIGNPNVLVRDEHWKTQIREIALSGGATGALVPLHDVDEEARLNELVRLVDSLSLDVNPREEEGRGVEGLHDGDSDDTL